jgi:hypothetical protein
MLQSKKPTLSSLPFSWNMPSQVGPKSNGTYQLLAYADDVNLLGDDIDNLKKNIQTSIDDNEEVGLVLNAQKTKYMLVSRQQNAG